MIIVLYVHIICAFLSLGLLIIRGAMLFSGRNWRAVKLLKILPHLSDTLLILSGVLILMQANALWQIWIIVKILLLALYIIFSAKTFGRKVEKANPLFWILACVSLLSAIGMAYWH